MKRSCLFVFIMLCISVLSVYSEVNKKDTYYVEKGANNIFITGGVGSTMGISRTNFDAGFFKAQNPYVYLGVGRMFHPNWSYRAIFSGWRASDFIAEMENKANFGNLQLDLIYNMSSAWGGYKEGRIFEASVFGGPYANYVFGAKSKMYPGISVGLQFKFNVNKYLAIDLEGRLARQREMTGMEFDRMYAIPTVGVTYTFGGKKVKKAVVEPCLTPVDPAEKATVKELNQYKEKTDELLRQLDEMNSEQEEMKQAIEDLKARAAVRTAGPVAMFFAIGQSTLDERGLVNVQLAASMIKDDPYHVYIIRGYADMSTGSPERNRNLSEARANAVYNALVEAGVDSKQLEIRIMGGQENLFGKPELNRMVIVERK